MNDEDVKLAPVFDGLYEDSAATLSLRQFQARVMAV